METNLFGILFFLENDFISTYYLIKFEWLEKPKYNIKINIYISVSRDDLHIAIYL